MQVEIPDSPDSLFTIMWCIFSGPLWSPNPFRNFWKWIGILMRPKLDGLIQKIWHFNCLVFWVCSLLSRVTAFRIHWIYWISPLIYFFYFIFIYLFFYLFINLFILFILFYFILFYFIFIYLFFFLFIYLFIYFFLGGGWWLVGGRVSR